MIKEPHLKIRQLRELRNYSQEYMSDQLNISGRAYSKIETGETQLTIYRVNQISEILEIDAIELLSFDFHQIYTKRSNERMGSVNDVQLSEKLVEQYELRIKNLEDHIQILTFLLGK